MSFQSFSTESSDLQENVPTASTATLAKLGQKGMHYCWARERHAEFMAWWTTTLYGKDHYQHGKKGNPKLDSTDQTSDAWQGFNQCALIESGQPAMCCKTCSKVFVHPTKNDSGTSSLETHMTRCVAIYGRAPGRSLSPTAVQKSEYFI